MQKQTIVMGIVGVFSMSAPALAQDNMSFMNKMEAGDCYMKVQTEPVYRTETERVLISEAEDDISIIPARYETRQERVLVQEASVELKKVPGRYENRSERVLISPERTEWKISRGDDIYAVLDTNGRPITKQDQNTGETLCKIKVPAVYRMVSKRVVISPPTVQRVEIPAKYQTISKRIVVQEARESRNKLPARYDTIQKTAMVSPGGVEWVPVLCRTNMTGERLTDIQQALKNRGLYDGPIDGIWGRGTMAGIDKFQQKNNLRRGGLTLETLRRLGIQI